ncbi:YjbF family lipoprotein [Shimia biformata]|uniref:YjbF family lipoprotein n=1 Tax=Shimia biformata TaxID=1294299 RepID=UPI00194E00E5|nr:YjbF family lipoprotein [Shimia biformata]
MPFSRRAPLTAVIVALGLVSACGNDTEKGRIGKNYVDKLKSGVIGGGGETQPQPTLEQMVAVVRQTVTDPLILIEMKDGGGTAAVVEIERNGPHVTYASADRRTIVMKGGMVTATRGLGQDLMSSDSDPSSDLVRARKSGEVTRVMRHIGGDDQSVERRFACQIAPGTRDEFKGSLHTEGTIMIERCRADDMGFTNSYVVSGKGQITESIQWLSPLRSYAQLLLMNM